MSNANRSLNRRAIHFALSLTVTAVFFVLLFSEEQQASFWETIAGVDAAGVVCFLGLGLTGDLLRAMRYRILLEDILPPGETPSFPKLLLVTLVRNAVVDMFPARIGELWYIYFLNRCGVPVAAGITSFAFCIVIDITVLIFLIGGFLLMSAAIPAVAPHGVTAQSSLLALGIVAALCALLALLLRYLPMLISLAAKIIRIVSGKISNKTVKDAAAQTELSVTQISKDFARLSQRNILLRLGFFTLLLRLCKYGALYVLLLAVVKQWGIGAGDIHPTIAMIAFLVAEASASLPISGLMGFGAYESSLVLVFSLSNISFASPLQTSLIIHLITQVKAYSLAFLAMVCLSAKEYRAEKAAP